MCVGGDEGVIIRARVPDVRCRLRSMLSILKELILKTIVKKKVYRYAKGIASSERPDCKTYERLVEMS